MRNHDGWLAMLALGLFVLITAPLAFQADPSEARVLLYAMAPPALLAGLVMIKPRARVL